MIQPDHAREPELLERSRSQNDKAPIRGRQSECHDVTFSRLRRPSVTFSLLTENGRGAYAASRRWARSLFSARCCMTRTTPGLVPIASAVSAAVQPSTMRMTSTSRWAGASTCIN